MKRMTCGVLAGVFLLMVCAGCGKAEPELSFTPSATVQALLDSGAFSEALEELDPLLLFPLNGEAEDYEGSVLYYSTGATSEAAAVIVVQDAGQTAAVEEALETWVEGQIEAVRNYQPAEVEKLEHAIVETRGNTVLLAVAADWEKAQAAVPAE